MSLPAANSRLVGDIGGTNTRLALYDAPADVLRHVCTYSNADYPGLAAVMETWLASLALPPPTQGCLAVAAPPFGDEVRMLNLDWSFSRSELEQRFGLAPLRCINDFEGNAYALPHLVADDRVTLRAGTPSGGKLAVVGAGTGLGGATLEFCVDTPVATASEPGHMGLSPVGELEIALFAELQRRHEEVYAELLLSGPGLALLCDSLARVRGATPPGLPAAAVTEAALADSDESCVEAVTVFCNLLGSLCGDYVLATGSYGGLFLAGGIVPRILPLLEQSDFIGRFTRKGGMQEHLSEVPLYAITSPVTGLIGAAHTPLAPPAGG